jgi:hypothetical protein
MNQFEQAESKELCQEEIQNHLNLKQKIYSITIDPILNEGRNLLKSLIGDDQQHNHQQQQQHSLIQTSAGARDSGYSGSSNESSSNEKFNYDYFNEANKIKEPMEYLRASKQKLQSLWQQKKIKLDQCLQLRIFEQECNQVREIINSINKIFLFFCYLTDA